MWYVRLLFDLLRLKFYGHKDVVRFAVVIAAGCSHCINPLNFIIMAAVLEKKEEVKEEPKVYNY
jgi:hypothetical protein